MSSNNLLENSKISAYLKPLVGQSIIYGIGNMLPAAVGFLLIPIYTRFLTPTDYGILSFASVVSSILTIFFVLGLHGAVVRFHYDFLENENEQRAYYGTIWLFITVVSLILTLLIDWQGVMLFSLISNEVPFQPYGRLAIWLAFGGVASVMPLAMWRVQGQATYYVLANLSRFAFMTLAIIFFVVKLKQGAAGSLKGQLLTVMIFVVPFTIVTLRNSRLVFHWEKLKSSLAFGLPLVPHKLSQWILKVSDRILIERFVSLDQLGIYSLGYNLGNMLGFILASVNLAWAPFFYRVAATEDEAPETFARLTTYYAMFVLMIGLGLSITAKEIVILVARPAFHEAYRVVPVVTLAFILHGIYLMSVTILFYTKQTRKLPLFTMVSAITNVVLNVLTLHRFGIMAAAWNTVASYAISAALVYRE
ncbi:MAG: lipopolysaccharide biosynthesis protein [Planctomycetota bacterium]|jgi:O-antigen/teichoic acid export membrane protein